MTKKNNQNKLNFIEIIDKTTSTLSDKNTIEQLSDILEEELALNSQQAQETINSISETIDIIDNDFSDLQNSKNQGKTRNQWLKKELDTTIDEYKLGTAEELIQGIKDNLKISNSQIGLEVFGEKLDLSQPLINNKYDGLNKTAIINDFQNEIKNNTLLGAISFENDKITLDSKHKEIQAVKDFFMEDLDSPQDKIFKTAISTATFIAKEKEILPKDLTNKSPEEISMIVDKGVTAAKIAYKLGSGELSPLDAVEYTIDRNVAILNSAIAVSSAQYGGIIGANVGRIVGSVFGPIGTVAGNVIGNVVGKVAGSFIGNVIGVGVKKIANTVKSVAKTAWKKVQSVTSNIGKSISNFFGW